MKTKLFIVLLFLIFTSLNAQNNIGVDYYNVKEYELAKKYFLRELPNNPAEANYYLGEIAFAEGRLDEAAQYYNQGLQSATDPYCRIGLAKIDLKTGRKVEATSTLVAIQKKYPKEIDILTAIGYAYLENQLYDDVQSLLKTMQRIDNSNPKIYVLEGDMLRADKNTNKNIGASAGKYDMAIYFDPNFALAYMKMAEVYEKSSWQMAVEKLKELIQRKPDYIIAYRYLGKIYTSNGYYQSALDAFKTYFAAGNYTLDDIARYVTALYFSKNYDDAYKMIKEGLAVDPNYFVLNRLQMYLAANTLNTDAGLNYATHFFSLKPKQAGDYIALDYSMYALILKEAKKYDEAFIQYKQALDMDSTSISIYKDIANIAGLKGQNDLAADYYTSYINKSADKVDVRDYFQLGRYYYSASTIRTASDTLYMLNKKQDPLFIKTIAENELQRDSLQNFKQLFIEKAIKYYLIQADKVFDKVIELAPDGYTGYLWKARTNSLIDADSEMGLAKPFYEKTIEILSNGYDVTAPGVKNMLIEAYSYLGYFYYIKNDSPNTILFWNKVLELDPQNANANAVLKEIK